jgi:hypothetical protein
MMRLLLGCVAALGIAAGAAAHTLDEYVQAVRVRVTLGEFFFSLDFTPGANVAHEVMRRLDSNGDGTFSPQEAEGYARAAVADLSVVLDDAALPLSLAQIELPTAEEMLDGRGVIRLKATAPGPPSPGVHKLTMFNAHMPSVSVYLANALLAESPGVRIIRQTRDQRQQAFRLDFEIRERRRMTFHWLLLAGGGLAALVWLRRA